MRCQYCGLDEDVRFGCCFDCASAGEERAARRTVMQHIWKGLQNLARRSPNYRFDFKWAWERASRTGDYAPNGEFSYLGLFKEPVKRKWW